MFIRVKRIKGFEYAYLVKNEWIEGKTRQKVVKYLGKVIDFNRVLKIRDFLFFDLNLNMLEDYILENYYEDNKYNYFYGVFEFILNIILESLGFLEVENTGLFHNKHVDNLIFYRDKLSFYYGSKPCVLRLNEGFLSDYSLFRIRDLIVNFNVNDKDSVFQFGKDLARALIDAGILLSKDDFQRLILFFLRNPSR